MLCKDNVSMGRQLKVFVIWNNAEARILQRSPKFINATGSMLCTTVGCTRGLEIMETDIETRNQTFKLVVHTMLRFEHFMFDFETKSYMLS